jgi:hypothetical protein
VNITLIFRNRGGRDEKKKSTHTHTLICTGRAHAIPTYPHVYIHIYIRRRRRKIERRKKKTDLLKRFHFWFYTSPLLPIRLECAYFKNLVRPAIIGFLFFSFSFLVLVFRSSFYESFIFSFIFLFPHSSQTTPRLCRLSGYKTERLLDNVAIKKLLSLPPKRKKKR